MSCRLNEWNCLFHNLYTLVVKKNSLFLSKCNLKKLTNNLTLHLKEVKQEQTKPVLIKGRKE